jgi:hypothetical protein
MLPNLMKPKLGHEICQRFNQEEKKGTKQNKKNS